MTPLINTYKCDAGKAAGEVHTEKNICGSHGRCSVNLGVFFFRDGGLISRCYFFSFFQIFTFVFLTFRVFFDFLSSRPKLTPPSPSQHPYRACQLSILRYVKIVHILELGRIYIKLRRPRMTLQKSLLSVDLVQSKILNIHLNSLDEPLFFTFREVTDTEFTLS